MKKIGFIFIIIMSAIIAIGQSKVNFTSQNNDEFARTIADTTVQIIDVRTAKEYAQEHIPRSVNIDIQSSDFDDKINKLDKNKAVAVYCRSGRRSKTAANKIALKGYKVYELNGGIINWKGKTIK